MIRAVQRSCLVAIALWLCPACSPRSQGVEAPAAAESVAAQKELRRLENEWKLRSGQARTALRSDLEEFLERHRTDPSSRRARVMLAQIALLERRLDDAQDIVEPLLEGPPGPARDEARVIEAAVESRRGHYDEALEILEPLEGKLLSREARDQFARERINAAIAARRWRLTVEAMRSWLDEAGTNSRHVREWIESAIVQVPKRALSRLLSDWSRSERSTREPATQWIHRLIIEHLSREALRSRDPHLARDLLEQAPPWLRAGESGDDLALLAALAQREARIVGRGIGIVLGGEDDVGRRRSTRVAMGLVRGLDLAQGDGASEGVRLLAAERRGSTAAALGTLSGLGASILVAGVDEESATQAMSFARSRSVPVITMYEPRSSASSPYGFVFGVGRDAQRRAATVGTEPGTWALVGTEDVDCPPPGTLRARSSLPFQQWQDAGVESVLVFGDAACCDTVSQTLSGLSWSPRVVWGLEGAHGVAIGYAEPDRLGSGAFPQPPEQAMTDQVGPWEQAIEGGRAPPTLVPRDWYYSLGLDAAALVAQALRGLPETRATERDEVKRRHELARSALLDARAPLKTSDSQGFNSAGRVDRAIRVIASGEGTDGR